MKYEDVPRITRADAEAAFASDSPPDISRALVSLAYHENDLHWVQSTCLRFTNHSNLDVVGSAVTCLGHLARIHGFLELEKVMPILSELERNPSLAGRVEDALDDIAMFAQKIPRKSRETGR